MQEDPHVTERNAVMSKSPKEDPDYPAIYVRYAPYVDVPRDLNDAALCETGIPDMLEVAQRWIVDTGCGSDLISEKLVSHLSNLSTHGAKKKFNTAGGHKVSDLIIPLCNAAFG